MKYYVFLLLMFTISCSFKGEEKKQVVNEVENKSIEEVKENLDSDGDLVLDVEEIKMGKNPLIANLPKLKVRFLQNYKIDTTYKELGTGAVGSFDIDTKVRDTDPDFKYRVGEIFIRDNSYKVAANVGKFESHSWGEIEEHDLSWVKYPEIDPTFFHEQSLLNRKYFEEDKFEIDTISITLENSVKLMANRGFRQIRNLEINFYYYNYETEVYELLKTEKIERHFKAGVNETFEVKIENIPASLLKDNYFKRGEFIISEIKDFEISELGTTYQKILASVKSKTVPVIYNTPLDSSIDYVAIDSKGKRFIDVLEMLFPKKVRTEEDLLTKVNQFSNNLPEYTYLKEVEKEDKKGKWFVLTNRLEQHYLDHKFTPNDVIVLSYITGKVLASQKDEVVYSFRENISGGADYKMYPLGNISPNSEIDIQISPKRKWGVTFSSEDRNYRERPCSCGTNCICGILTVDCFIKVNIFKSYDNGLSFNKNLSGELERISLIINNSEFTLKNLVDKKAISLSWKGNNIHLKITDPSKIIEINNFDENVMFLKLQNINGTTFQGAYLHNATGKHRNLCPQMTTFASDNWGKIGVYSGSVMMDKFQRYISYGLKILPPRPYRQSFSVSVISVINNMFN